MGVQVCSLHHGLSFPQAHTTYKYQRAGVYRQRLYRRGIKIRDLPSASSGVSLLLPHDGQNIHDCSFTPKLISDQRMFDAADVLLTMQNPSGGYASYEPVRGPKFLEWLNPAEVFGMFSLSFDVLLSSHECILDRRHHD